MTNLTKAIAVLGVVAGLGVAALPLSSYAVTVIDGEAPAEGAVEGATYDGTKDGKVETGVGVMLKVEDELTIEADKSTTDKVDLSADGHTGNVTLTVVTNNQKGYNLTIKGSGANPLTLKSENDDEITAGTGTFAAPAALSTTVSEWGYRLASFEADKYAGVTTNDVEIKSTTTPTGNSGDETVVTFGASIKDGQPAGTYNGEVTFTATNNANS